MDEAQVRAIIQQVLVEQRVGKELPAEPGDFDIAQFVHNAGWIKRNLRFGVAVVTWPGGAAKSNDTTVTHGMMVAPTVVLAVPEATAGEGAGFSATVRNITGTTFGVYMEYVNGFTPSAPNNRNAHWIAIR
jgi:hypothetical protein